MDLFKSKAWTEVHEGGFFYVPPGGIHAFWNSSDVPVSMLMLFAPGNARERYFEEPAEIVAMAERSTKRSGLICSPLHDQVNL